MDALALIPASESLSDADLEDAITTLAAERHAAEYRFLTLHAELERRRGWFGDFERRRDVGGGGGGRGDGS